MLKKSSILVFLTLTFGMTIFGQEIRWLNDIKAAQRTARETGKPILYDFSADWCKPCQAMERDFWPKPEVVEISKGFICVKVNFDTERNLADKYGVSSIPNVIFTDPWGRGLTYHKGFGSATTSQILEKFKLLPANFNSVIDAGNALETDEKNLVALQKMATFYQDHKLYWQATEFLKRILKLESDATKRENTRMNLAFNLIRINEPGDAIGQFESLQKEYPNSSQAPIFLYGILIANVRKNKIDKAEKFLAELRSRFPDSKLISEAEKAVFEAKGNKKE